MGILRKVFSRFKKKNSRSIEETFSDFCELIKKNNRCLEIISDIGEKLSGEYIFDSSYIETSVKELLENVYSMIYYLEAIAPGKYSKLIPVYKKIRSSIEAEVKGNIIIPHGGYVLPLHKIKDELQEVVGGKNANLGAIKNILSLNVPDGFVITTKGFFNIIKESDISKEISDTLNRWEEGEVSTPDASKYIRELILKYKLPGDLIEEVDIHINKLKKRIKKDIFYCAVRSSAVAEDSEFSFAGIYKTFLGVPPPDIPYVYKRVIASTFSERALEYRKNKNLMESEVAMAVGCQEMVNAKLSGVLYTIDPHKVEEDRMILVVTYGLGDELVEGKKVGDKYYISRSSPHHILSRTVVHKPTLKRMDDTGKIVEVEVPEEKRDKDCILDSQIEEIVKAGFRIEKYFKRPQDIEFAFDENDTLYILQSRPLILEQKGVESIDKNIEENVKVVFASKGEIVQRGVGMGEVFKIESMDDLSRVPEGAILVSPVSSPAIAKVIKKVNGIITDVGSPIGHMATIAREFRVPTIINTKNATRILKNGQKITLNAVDNVVYDGYVKEVNYYNIFEEKFEEVKEYRLLKRVYKKISPLNLLDPLSGDFSPENCKTLHDLIRFMHEKAVQELIDQNYYKLPNGEGCCRLKLDIPLDLIVIDIAGELKKIKRELEISDIYSMPLRHFIKGVNNPNVWSTNPVEIGIKSFVSSMNKTFSVEVAGPKFVGQNLAVISDDYANISLRLGYHYTMLDTIACSKSNENYIYFRFMGGVSEDIKRSRRAKLIGEILFSHDFFVEIRKDLVVARLKGLIKEEILEKIYLLGVLVAFTRQLDVCMEDERSIEYFSKEFNRILLKVKSEKM